ncbi:vWA domain-containing protein [Acrocarpospora macrocephala]|uniref:vWA domain-containing protein n=1 Tax=Acrocarpospora macrocephala TaxID=150177 RepID=UPI001478487B|nr:vWA domain-containing protein [Acrocarpospora macrocephala]
MRRTVTSVLGCLITLLVTLQGSAAADDDLSPIYHALKLDDRVTTYLVLVDISGSVNDRFPYIRQQLRDLLRENPRDKIRLIPFAERVQTGIPINSEADLDDLPKATGQHTDLGVALEFAISELELGQAAGTVQDASIMVLSDRIHEPPPGSHYPNKRTESWKELKRRADRLQKLLPGMSLYIVPITKGIRLDRERGNAVDWVFPMNVIHDPDGRATDLRAAKEERLRQEATRLLWPDRELTLIGKVIGPGTIDAMRGTARATVEFVSPAVWTPVEISTIRSATRGVTVTPVDRGPWALAPSKRSVSIMVDVSWRTPGRRFLDHDAPLPLRVKVVADVTTSWRPGLDKLKFNGPVPLAETGEFPLFRDGGIHVPGTWPRWLVVAGAVLLIVAAMLFVRWFRNQRRMSGYLCLLVAYGGDDGIRQERLGPYELARHRDLDIHFDRPTRQELGRTATATTEKAQAKVSRTPGLRRSQRGLIVSYSADGSPATPQRVPYNDHFLIHGVDFIHHDHYHDTDVTSCDAPVESES